MELNDHKKFILVFSFFLPIFGLLSTCSLFTWNNSDSISSIQPPPQKLAANDASLPKLILQQNESSAHHLKLQKESSPTSMNYFGIPQVNKSAGGQTSVQLKTDSLNKISNYNIFPQKLIIMNPDTNLSNSIIIPSWQIEW
jgi:hypothetical protein